MGLRRLGSYRVAAAALFLLAACRSGSEGDGRSQRMLWTTRQASEATMLLGLRTVAYEVDDLQAAKAWYTEALGYGPYFDEAFYVGFNVGGYELGLVPAEEDAHTGLGGTTVYWGVEDIEGAMARLTELGATVHGEIVDVGEGIMVASVVDPFGNLLGVIRNPYFGATVDSASVGGGDQ